MLETVGIGGSIFAATWGWSYDYPYTGIKCSISCSCFHKEDMGYGLSILMERLRTQSIIIEMADPFFD